ncbi:MAG: stalk domain-containing protein, partial [Thermacetogeniaceae bacterium]
NPESSNTAVAYSGPFTVSQSETVLAAIHDPTTGWSSVASATLSISGSSSLQAPVISPGSGDYSTAQSVSISDIYGSAYYTTDGSNPETSNTRITYTGPFTVSQSETIQAVNYSSAGWSSVTSVTFSISGSSSLQAPVISPGSGDYSTAQSVYISDIYGAAYYTTDGSNPEGSSTAVAYSGPFTVSQSETIQAVNYSSAGWSSVTSATFSISGSSTIQTGANSEQIDQLKQEILAAVNSNNWSNAEEILKQIIEIQQSDWAFTQLGQIYQQQGNSGVSVFSNGSQLDFDVQPVIVNDRTLVPIRGIANALGISDNNVSYSNGTVTVNNGSSQIQISNNGQQAYLNGTAYSLDVPAQIVNGRMMVPLRAIGQMFNKNVQWYPSGRIVNIQ